MPQTQGGVQALHARFFEFKMNRTSNPAVSLTILEELADRLSRAGFTMNQQQVFARFIVDLPLPEYDWQVKELQRKNKDSMREGLLRGVREQFAILQKEQRAGKKRIDGGQVRELSALRKWT